MKLRTRLHELKLAIGSPRAVFRKLTNLASTLFNLWNPRVRRRRLERLRSLGLIAAIPTGFQLILGSWDMLTKFLLPSNIEFNSHRRQNHAWRQLLRLLDEPSAMADPVGIGASRDMVISHLVQVVHTSAGYDVALLEMFPDGLDKLEDELRQLVAGTHPRQAAIAMLHDTKRDYPARLLDALQDYRADRERYWEVMTYRAPAPCTPLFVWGIEKFGSPGRFVDHALQQPPTLRAWFRARLPEPRLPAPELVEARQGSAQSSKAPASRLPVRGSPSMSSATA